MAWIFLATEDELSEAVGDRLLAETSGRLEANTKIRRGGFGSLRSNIGNFCQMARFQPVFLITDLDRASCPADLQRDWLRRRKKPTNLLFRVAVREVEAWLLGDRQAISELLKAQIDRIPQNPDQLGDPKATLLSLARRAPRDIRNDLVAQEGAVAYQGLGYNAVLTQFVREKWNPEIAAEQSESLHRTRRRLQDLSHQVA